MSSRVARSAILTVAVCVICIALMIAAGVSTRILTQRCVATSARLSELHLQADNALIYQLDEQAAVRGYVLTHRKSMLIPFFAAEKKLDPLLVGLAQNLMQIGIARAAESVAQARRLNTQWRTGIALPIIDGHAHRNLPGLQIIASYRAEIMDLNTLLADEEHANSARTIQAIDQINMMLVFMALFIIIGGATFTYVQRRGIARLERAYAKLRLENQRGALLRAAYEAEKRIADRLQDAMSQRHFPEIPALSFSATYVPATEETRVGGDWYDTFELPGGRIFFAIGDVAGHGIDAAVTMNHVRHYLTASAVFKSDPANILQHVNTQLVRLGVPMVTAIVGYVDSRTCEVVYAVAGHPEPVLAEPGHTPRFLGSVTGLPLGISDGETYTTMRVRSKPGAMLVLYTDGAIEHSRDVTAGEHTLLATVAKVSENVPDPAQAIHQAIFSNRPVTDDVAILTITFEALTLTSSDIDNIGLTRSRDD